MTGATALRSTEDHRLVGGSASIRDLEAQIDAAANSDSRVLITGESGSGKEVVAHLIHARSPRRRAHMATINCAGFPDSLLESELFGHVRGGFTGAERDRGGVLKSADGGTLFMDEVGEMSLRMQAVLLRFLETGELERVGSDRAAPRVNVRIVAATNRNPEEAIRDGLLRADLHFRLNVIHIHVPPLREHREDVPVLLAWFSRSYGRRYGVAEPRIASDALDLLVAYDWPGNVRQLKNVVERLVVVGAMTEITAEHLPPEFTRGESPAPLAPAAAPSAPDELLDRIINGGESFWTAAHQPFLSRDLTREDVRELVRRGLEHVGGDFLTLSRAFHIEREDDKRFLSFIRKAGFGPIRLVKSA